MKKDMNVVAQDVAKTLWGDNITPKELDHATDLIKIDNGKSLWKQLYNYAGEPRDNNYGLVNDVMSCVEDKANAYQLIAATVLAKKLMVFNTLADRRFGNIDHSKSIDDTKLPEDVRLNKLVDFLTSTDMETKTFGYLSEKLLDDKKPIDGEEYMVPSNRVLQALNGTARHDVFAYFDQVRSLSILEHNQGFGYDSPLMNNYEFDVVAHVHQDWLKGLPNSEQGDFSNRTIVGVNALDLNLQDSKFNNSVILDGDFELTNLTGSDFTNCMFEDTRFNFVDTNDCILENAKYCDTSSFVRESNISLGQYTINREANSIPLDDYMLTVDNRLHASPMTVDGVEQPLEARDEICELNYRFFDELEFSDKDFDRLDPLERFSTRFITPYDQAILILDVMDTNKQRSLEQAAFNKAEALCSNIESEDVEQDCEYED